MQFKGWNGVLIFVAGQYILRLIIEPAQELKKTLGSISYIMLLKQAELTNANFNKEIAIEIKTKSAEIVSKSNMIICYNLVKKYLDYLQKQIF